MFALLLLAQQDVEELTTFQAFLAWVPLIVIFALLILFSSYCMKQYQKTIDKNFDYMNLALEKADETNRLLADILQEIRQQIR